MRTKRNCDIGIEQTYPGESFESVMPSIREYKPSYHFLNLLLPSVAKSKG